MKPHPQWLLALIAGIVPALGHITTAHAAPTYRLLTEIPIGGDGFWDYLSIDPEAHRLYVSHATEIAVIDTESNKVVGHIADTPGVHGLAIAADLGKGFSSNGKENKSSIVDLKSLQTLSKTETGDGPDAILYDPASKEVYTFNGHGQSATAFDANSGKVTATIALGGKPEFAVFDPATKLIFNNLEDKNAVAVIDPAKHAVVKTWPIAPGEAASGLALDEANHRLFLGCDNKLMAMMNSDDGKVVATVPIGQGVDANAFDPATQLAFSSCGDGTVTIAHEDSPEKLTVVQTLATEKGARTMTLDPKTHRIYLTTAKFEAAPAQAPGAPRQRPKIVPGSTKVLVYAPDGLPKDQ